MGSYELGSINVKILIDFYKIYKTYNFYITENWKNCRLTDNITITTALLPFLDVNKKVSYKRSDSDREHQYIITSVSHDFAGFTTTITMYRFYPLYETLLKERGTHKVLSEFTHGVLSKYTHDELATVISEQEL